MLKVIVPEAGELFTDTGEAPCVMFETAKEGKTLTFLPTDDATIRSGSPEKNYGSDSELQVDNDPIDNFLIKFVVSGLDDRPVLRAKLRLYNVNGSDLGKDFYHVADNTWIEDNVTWNSAPLADAISLASLGPVSKASWFEVDLTSLVIKEGTYSLRISTTARDGADYVSEEAVANLAPRLIISVGEIDLQNH